MSMIAFLIAHDAVLVGSAFGAVFLIACLKYFAGERFKFFTYRRLVVIAILFLVFHTLLLIGEQYYVWENGSVVTKTLLRLPLPPQVPLTFFLEPFRGLVFKNTHGYFVLYSTLNLVLPSFSGLALGVFIAGAILFVSRLRKIYLPSGDISFVVMFSALMGFGSLGFMRTVFFIVCGFLVAIVAAIVVRMKKWNPVPLSLSWLIAAPVAFLVGWPISMNLMHLLVIFLS